MKPKIDLTIERLIKAKFKNIDNAKKDKRISALLRDSVDVFSLSKIDKVLLIKILES